MFRRLVLLLLALVLLAGGYVAYLASAAGELRRLEPHAPGPCQAVTGAPGPEDITIDHLYGVALISSLDRGPTGGELGEPWRGEIFALELSADSSRPAAGLRVLTGGFAGELVPHGISLYRGPLHDDGSRADALFVVNHPSSGQAIEIFDWDGRELRHRETIRDPALISPNDVLAVGPRSFYATNDHGSAAGPRRLAEDYLPLRRGQVVYYDGQRFTVVADRIGYANGINMSPSGDEVYVASSTFGRVHRYARDVMTGALEPLGELVLGTGPDNIEVDRHGMLWIGAHPKLLTFARAARRGGPSPSQVLWVDPEQASDPWLREVYLDLGDRFSASSVAAPFGARLLIGSVWEPHFLVCQYG